MNQNRPPPAPSAESPAKESRLVSAPAISLPKGGGAIRGIGEKFTANPVTGTGAMTVPIATSPGRSGFGPQLALSYNSGAGNGPFGLGWDLSLPSITRKTDRGLPRYLDAEESDVFILAGAEDLVPTLDADNRLSEPAHHQVYGKSYLVRKYMPRIEGGFALIERWVEQENPAAMFWRTITRDNLTTWYGRSEDSRLADPSDSTRIFQWFICETHDDKGNVASYGYRREDAVGMANRSVAESNRADQQRRSNCYLDRIRYGNRRPYFPALSLSPAVANATWPTPDDVLEQHWMFEVVFDYGEPSGPVATTVGAAPWRLRADPFSSHRAGFEIRTYRLCCRVLMFHHFETELGAADYLVRSTDFDYAEPTDLSHPLQPGYTLLRSITHRAYQKRSPTDATYESSQFPPVTFAYSQPQIDPTVRTIAPEELENLPVGIEGSGYRWIDLNGEGLSGVLTEQAGAWYYKPNLGDAKFGPMSVLPNQPSIAALGASQQQLMDLAGDGQIDLVDLGGVTPGFHQRDGDAGWKNFVPFAALPKIDWSSPNLRWLDLTGDGRADAVLTEEDVFTWYASLADEGFAAARRTLKAIDEKAGPHLVFADSAQTVFLADFCGDGLTDIVRIRNGEVCYWPNLGYGRFGRKITLDNSPRFDRAELYDPHRIRLADIDGSGPADLIYLGRSGAQLYFNRSGNSLSDAHHVEFPVATNQVPAVQVADLLGNGTACLVWNSDLPADAREPVRYIDLMGGGESSETRRRHEKPHLLIGMNNHLGGTTELEYTPSTRFYIKDKQSGTPWITRLPFPVYCVTRVTVRDQWRRTEFSSTYSYHHGYFDGAEREFRGFGRVEQVDVESFGKSSANNIDSPFVTQDQTLYQPPVKTITWFHTGAALERERMLGQFAEEYFPQRFADRLPSLTQFPEAFREKALPEPVLPDDLSAQEWREALRACKGMVLRQEIYELDIDDLAAAEPKETPVRIFSAALHNCQIQLLQARGGNPHAVFLVTESEALTYQYELALPKSGLIEPDPRIAHTLNLRHDEQGNLQQSVAIAYGRWKPGDHGAWPRADLITEVQAELHITYREIRYTNDLVTPEPALEPLAAIRHHRLRGVCETLSYELKGIRKADPRYYSPADFSVLHLSDRYGRQPGDVPPAEPIEEAKDYHEGLDGLTAQKRILEQTRTLFFDDFSENAPPSNPLPFGQHGPRGLKYEDYQLALTDSLLDAVFTQRDAAGTVIDDKLKWQLEPATLVSPKIIARDKLDQPVATGSSYLKSGYILGPGIAAPAGQYWLRSGTAGFADRADQHFFLPNSFTDPFNHRTTLVYDQHDLLVQSSSDMLGNTTAIINFDYRVLAPRTLSDINDNQTEVYFNILGMVVAVAVKSEGDDLSGFTFDLANPPLSERTEFFFEGTAYHESEARRWLDDATARQVYHLGETLDANGTVVWGSHPARACGILREKHRSQLKPATAAEAAELSELQVVFECSDGHGEVMLKKIQAEPALGTTDLRWIASGKTVVNNKGNAVKQYEPYFSSNGHRCEEPTEEGVTTLLYYDAIGRLVRSERPDGTFNRFEFSPWLIKAFDPNDTVLGSQWYRDRGSPDPTFPLVANASPETRAAWLAAQHAETPVVTILNSVGREAIAVAHERTLGSNGAWQETFSVTSTTFDSEGKPLWLRDARGNLVMQYIIPAKPNDDPSEVRPSAAAPAYDMAGNLLYQHSMDTGDRWMLMDAAGQPMLAWDFTSWQDKNGMDRDVERRLTATEYDLLHRPLRQWLTINGRPRQLVDEIEYGEGLPDAKMRNLRGRSHLHYDASGTSRVERLDSKGKPLEVKRRLTNKYQVSVLDWNVPDRSVLLESATETFSQLTEYDALGRVTRLYQWHRPTPDDRVAVIVPEYNQRGLLVSETLDVRARKTTTGHTPSGQPLTYAIVQIRYNAKGQKESLQLGNGTLTQYEYDPETFRLRQLLTTRPADSSKFPGHRSNLRDAGVVQQLLYTYDPVGNITEVEDQAYQPVFFDNGIAEPKSLYQYDALYRLIKATGRETAQGGDAAAGGTEPTFARAFPVTDQTLRQYVETYDYDPVGNIVALQHQVVNDSANSWTRHYECDPDSNRLRFTWRGSNRTTTEVEYWHDTHGNLLNLTNVAEAQYIKWDHRDMIKSINLGGGGTAYYDYAAGKQRTRKRIDNQNGLGGYSERIYLPGYELYRRYGGANPAAPVEEIESLHLSAGEERVLLVDDVITASDANNPRPDGLTITGQTLYRYQYSNHLGSACLELDDQSAVISYEEYHPYGTSAYCAKNAGVETPPKRYRFTGMERDEESGLGYHGARYYASWLGRWTSADPAGLADGTNLFAYAQCSPTRKIDRVGLAARDAAAVGDVDLHQYQGTRGELDPLTGKYPLESEHIDSIAIARENMRNPATGKSPIPEGRKHWADMKAPTAVLEKDLADAKTKLDMKVYRKLMAKEPVPAGELGPSGGLGRTAQAAAATGKAVPPGAQVAAIGQQDLYFGHPDVRKFSVQPENNPLVDVPLAEINASVETPVHDVAPGDMKSIAVSKEPLQKTVFRGNYSSVPAPEGTAGATTKAFIPLLLTLGWDKIREMNRERESEILSKTTTPSASDIAFMDGFYEWKAEPGSGKGRWERHLSISVRVTEIFHELLTSEQAILSTNPRSDPFYGMQ